MEEKKREEDDDNDDYVVEITAVQFFGMPDEAFLGKETDNNKKKEEENEKRKDGGDDSGKNSGGGAKRGENMRGGINMSASNGDSEDNAESWDGHDFDVGRKEGSEWKMMKGTRTTTKRASRRRRRKKRGGGSHLC